MKTIVTLLVSTLLLVSCSGEKKNGPEQLDPSLINNPASADQNNSSNEDLPAFDFKESTYDFGTIESGVVLEHEFTFRNSGDADLIISQANGSCGCTVPEYPKEPVKPGDEGVIKVTFRSEGQGGSVAKTITLLANTVPNTKVLTISGEVIKTK